MVFIPLLKLTIKNAKVIQILMTANPIIIKLNKFKKIKRKIKSFFGIPRDFYSCHLYSSSSFFNLCSSWNINGLNSEKKDGVMYLNSVLNLYVYAFRKLVIVSFSLMGTLLLFLVMSLFSFVLISKSLE